MHKRVIFLKEVREEVNTLSKKVSLCLVPYMCPSM